MPALPRPDAPPSNLVRAAQARLVAQLHARDVPPTLPISGDAKPQTATPWPGPLRAPAEAVDDERYEFGEVFAAGGLGLIRKARDRRLGRTIAVKELLRSDPAAERRFTLEAAITARLQHPGIVPLYDIGRYSTGEPYYCMKLIDGESLERRIRGCSGLAERLGLLEHVIDAADAIAFAHRHNIIHRDLKPANILIGELGETVVIDWGLAKDLGGAVVEAVPDLPPQPANVDSTMTQHGTVLGTLRYMPPEQARGLPADARSDVFALGAVLHHILAGAPPHAEVDDRRLATLVSEGVAPELAKLVPEAPRELVAIAVRAMDPLPERRYASAEAFVDDLRRFRTGRLVGAHRYAPGEVVRLWLRRHRPVVAVVSAALVALAGVGGYAVQKIRDQRDVATLALADAEAARAGTEMALAAAGERANAALLAQARGALDTDVAAALASLARVDLSDGTASREVRLLAHAAGSRGAPTRALPGHGLPVAGLVALSDGGLVSVDLGGEVRRWDPLRGTGAPVLALGEQRVQLIAAAGAPVFAAIGASAAHVVQADGRVQVVDLAGISRGDDDATRHYEFALSRDGGVLAALGQAVFGDDQPRGAAAYRWDLRRAPLVREATPHERFGVAVLGPDGRELAYQVEHGPAVVLADGVTTPLPGLRRPLGFSSSGRQVYGFPFGGPARNVAFDRDSGELRELGRWTLAVTPDDGAVVLDFHEFTGAAQLSLRDLATGERRWQVFFDRSESLSQWGDHAEFAVAVDPRGLGLAIRARDQWLLGDLATGRLDRSLDIGHHPRGLWLADGGFAVAHDTEIWAWDPAAHAPIVEHAAVSADGARAIVASGAGSALQLRDMSSGTSTDSPCLDVAPEEMEHPRARFAVDGRGRVLVSTDAGLCLALPGGPAQRLALPDPAGAAPTRPVAAGGPPTTADEALAERLRELGERRPGQATALALGAGERLAVGRAGGELFTWERPGAAPRRHQVGDAVVMRLTAVGAGYVAITENGVFAAREDGVRELVRLAAASLPAARLKRTALAVHPYAPVVAVVVPDEQALHLYDFAADRARRWTAKLALPAVAYSPTGLLAVAVGGRGVQVMRDLDDAGRTLALPEEAISLGFVDEQRLAVLGDRGALICVDVPSGASAVCKRGFGDGEPMTLSSPGSGALFGFDEGSRRVVPAPADVVPQDDAALGEWLQARRVALARE